jgi:hypothetical protein
MQTRANRRIVAIAAIGALTGAYLWQSSNGKAPATPAATLRGSVNNAAVASFPYPAGTPDATRNCAAPSPLFSASAYYISVAPNQAIMNQAYTQPDALAARTSSDPEAGLALYKMWSYCASVPNRDAGPTASPPPVTCPVVAMETMVRNHPIELLQRAASLGSIAAKIMFIADAPDVADEFRKSGAPEDAAFARELLKNSERFGSDAARSGSRDAMRLMSAAYESGRFGSTDIVRAYAFGLPLQSSGTPADARRLAALEARLSDGNRRLATLLAFGCEQALDSRTAASPFQ